MIYEFIVWDDTRKRFVERGDVIYSFYGETRLTAIPNEMEYTDKDIEFNKFNIFSYIGKTDINNKEIYADCSILEFTYFSSSGWVDEVGYFKWDDENLRYEVHLEYEKETVPFNPLYFDAMEVVDTIQENKLGLIK